MPDAGALVGAVAAPELSVMTLNVQRARASSRGWEKRSPRVRTLLQREQPTIFVAQEALPHQARVVRDALGASYRFVGRGRNADGRGEGCPVFWDDRRLQLVRWDQQALSQTPDVAGSRSWGSLFPRILTLAVFRDRVTRARFAMINTHLDVLSPVARERAVALLRAAGGDDPVLLAGDFNAGPGSRPRRALDEAGFVDTWSQARERLTPEWGTYAAHREPRAGGPRIDAIHTRGFDVARVGIEARHVCGGRPSDHLPVLAVVRIGGLRS